MKHCLSGGSDVTSRKKTVFLQRSPVESCKSTIDACDVRGERIENRR